MEDSFLHWSIGAVPSFEVKCEASLVGMPLFWEWVTLVDGERLVAQGRDRRQLPLHFPRRSDAPRVRDLLRSRGAHACWRLRLEVDSDDAVHGSGVLELVTGALPAVLSGELVVEVPDAAWGELRGTDRATLKVLQDELAFPYAGTWRAVLETPLLVAGASGGMVALFTSKGWRIDAAAEGPPGQQCFVARSIAREKKVKVPAARLVTLSKPPRVVAQRLAGSGADLSILEPTPNPLLRAWLDYEGVERENAEAIFAQRQECPLAFRDFEPGEDGAFVLSLTNSMDAKRWLHEGQRFGSKLGVTIQVFDELQQGEGREAELLRLIAARDGQVTAVIEFQNPAHRPSGAGRLLPAENKGSKRQRERREEVLAHIRSGQFANPRLLEILYDPSKTESVAVKESTFRRSHGSAHRLEGKQTEAVAKAAKLPELLLIQGPPGTGKTSVLAELVRVLSERWAKDEELGRPFRILVAGAHNEAVRNAYERIGETSVVRLIASADEARKAQAVMGQKGRAVAEALRSRLAADPRWGELQQLRALAQRLALVHQRALARELVSVSQQLEALEHDASPEVLNPRLFSELSPLRAVIASATTAASSQLLVDAGPSAALPAALEAFLSMPTPKSHEAAGEVAAVLERALGAARALPSSPPAVGAADALEAALGDLRRKSWSAGAWSSALESLEDARSMCTDLAASLGPGAATPADPVPPRDEPFAVVLRWTDEARAIVETRLELHAQDDGPVLQRWVEALEEDERAYEQIESRHASIHAATCQLSAKAPRDENDYFDVVIVDEAARAGIDVLIPMSLARHVVLVGDHRQLPPHIEERLWGQLDAEVQRTASMRSSLFQWLQQTLPSENFVALQKQYRMHEDIGRLVSKAFYEPEVTLDHHFAGPRAAERLSALGLFDNQPVVLVDTSDRPDRARAPCIERNVYEAEIIQRLLARLDPRALERYVKGGAEHPVALLSYYSEQRQLLSDLVGRLPPGLRERIEVATVASVQGREFPLVIIATTRSAEKVGMLRELNSANVAISRAQSQVIVLGDQQTLCRKNHGSTPWREVFRLVAEGHVPGRIIKGGLA